MFGPFPTAAFSDCSAVIVPLKCKSPAVAVSVSKSSSENSPGTRCKKRKFFYDYELVEASEKFSVLGLLSSRMTEKSVIQSLGLRCSKIKMGLRVIFNIK